MQESGEELDGTALSIYVYLLESGEPRSVREIAKALGIAPSTVHYHLKKLQERGLVASEGAGYRVARVVKLEGFYYIFGKLIPRFAVYSMFYAGAALGAALSMIITGYATAERVLLALLSLSAAAIFVFEWRRLEKRIRARQKE